MVVTLFGSSGYRHGWEAAAKEEAVHWRKRRSREAVELDVVGDRGGSSVGNRGGTWHGWSGKRWQLAITRLGCALEGMLLEDDAGNAISDKDTTKEEDGGRESRKKGSALVTEELEEGIEAG
ncbi:hypothetical protein BHE74_00045051 [Ensete ventricosum]|nr:hypothetical protein BHE74_00045051 [Ensete ventricosum]